MAQIVSFARDCTIEKLWGKECVEKKYKKTANTYAGVSFFLTNADAAVS